jgi:hypothetical protein
LGSKNGVLKWKPENGKWKASNINDLGALFDPSVAENAKKLP